MSPEILLPHNCVNFKKLAPLNVEHWGCGYTPGCDCAPPSPICDVLSLASYVRTLIGGNGS